MNGSSLKVFTKKMAASIETTCDESCVGVNVQHGLTGKVCHSLLSM